MKGEWYNQQGKTLLDYSQTKLLFLTSKLDLVLRTLQKGNLRN